MAEFGLSDNSKVVQLDEWRKVVAKRFFRFRIDKKLLHLEVMLTKL